MLYHVIVSEYELNSIDLDVLVIQLNNSVNAVALNNKPIYLFWERESV